MNVGLILATVEVAAIKARAEAESHGTRRMTADEWTLFRLGFIAGVQHGLAVAGEQFNSLLDTTASKT